MFWFFEREWLVFTFARILYCEAGTQSKRAPSRNFLQQVNAARRSLWEGVSWPPSVERYLTRETSQRTSGTPLHEWDEDWDNLQFCLYLSEVIRPQNKCGQILEVRIYSGLQYSY